MFIGVNFSKLTGSNQIFKIDISSVHFHLIEISCHIIAKGHIIHVMSYNWVPYGQKGVDGRSQWMTGMRKTEVRLDGWCEGGLCQQRNDGGGCATIYRKGWRALVHTYVTGWVSLGHFCLALCSFRPPSVLWWLSHGEGMDAVTWCGWNKL